MGNELQRFSLSQIHLENINQCNLLLNKKFFLQKLKSSLITFPDTKYKSSLQLKIYNFEGINSKPFFKEINQNGIKNDKHANKKAKDVDFQKPNLSFISCNEKTNNSFLFEKKTQKEKRNNYSVKKNRKKLLNFKTKFEENIEREKILKKYLESNNELLLSEEAFKQAYKILKENVTKYKYPVSHPIAITLGGQPGAGKSNLYDIARKRFSKNIVELDCDAFRVFHPYYKQIKKIFGKDDAIKTNPFVFKAVDLLIEELSDEKYNLIIESSLNSPNSALDNGKNLRPKGYKVELHIMATPKQISWQGTIDRYNRELKNEGSPRAVSKEFHDKVVENICNSLDIVKKSGLMSNILIYDRNKTCLYDMKKDTKKNPCKLLNSIINGQFLINYNLLIFLAYLNKSSTIVL